MNSDTPYISIIIPVYNAANIIGAHLEALLTQSYPRDRYEIIYVDNGSTDGTPEIIKKSPSPRLLSEPGQKNPYRARNTGIKAAKGDIIALVDVNCVHEPQWLEYGISDMTEKKADLLAGKITFIFPARKTAAQLVDSVTYAQVEDAVKKTKSAPGGNLFARKQVIEKIGLFPGFSRSGEDSLWTHRAVKNGFTLNYSGRAEVFYKARGFMPLLKKSFRVGVGAPYTVYANTHNLGQTFIAILRRLAFFKPGNMRKALATIDDTAAKNKMQLYTVLFFTRLSLTFGFFIGFIKLLVFINKIHRMT